MQVYIYVWKEGTTGEPGHYELVPAYIDYKGHVMPSTSMEGKVVIQEVR